jgi:hypothetical protein
MKTIDSDKETALSQEELKAIHKGFLHESSK